MLLNERKGVFETNSSSMHSLSISTDADDTVHTEDCNTIIVGDGEFGWGYEQLTSWLEKADYFGVECRHDDDWRTGEPSTKELTPHQIKRRDLLTGAIGRKYPNIKLEFGGGGYIDHQSRGDIWAEVFDSEDPETMLFNIIFGDYVIIIDNDNH